MPSPHLLMRHTTSRRVSVLAGAAAMLVNTACYSFQPAAPSVLTPSSDVQLRLTHDGSTQLQPLLGPDVRQLNGQLQEILGDSAVVVLLDDVMTAEGSTLPWRRGRITVPLRLTESVEQRTLDRRRTRTVAIAAAAVFVAVVTAAIKRAGYSGSSKGGAGSGPPE